MYHTFDPDDQRTVYELEQALSKINVIQADQAFKLTMQQANERCDSQRALAEVQRKEKHDLSSKGLPPKSPDVLSAQLKERTRVAKKLAEGHRAARKALADQHKANVKTMRIKIRKRHEYENHLVTLENEAIIRENRLADMQMQLEKLAAKQAEADAHRAEIQARRDANND